MDFFLLQVYISGKCNSIAVHNAHFYKSTTGLSIRPRPIVSLVKTLDPLPLAPVSGGPTDFVALVTCAMTISLNCLIKFLLPSIACITHTGSVTIVSLPSPLEVQLTFLFPFCNNHTNKSGLFRYPYWIVSFRFLERIWVTFAVIVFFITFFIGKKKYIFIMKPCKKHSGIY